MTTGTPLFLTRPAPHDMPASADVVIIGGGPAGAGALWALAQADPTLKLVLLERGRQIASGASNASLENYRSIWPPVCNQRLLARSIEVFEHAHDHFGVDIGVHRRGYLFVGFTPKQAETLRSDVQHMHAIGVPHIEYLDANEMRYRFGWLGERPIAGKYDPVAGHLDSYALVNALVRASGRATILLETEDVRIRAEGGRVLGVDTRDGFIAAPRVLIAAGADSRRIARTAGIDIPIVIRPRQSFTTAFRHAEFPPDAPMLIGAPPFPHVRPEAQTGAIFGWEYSWNARQVLGQPLRELEEPTLPADRFKDPRFPSLVLALFARQFGHTSGGFASSGYFRGIDHRAGYYVYRDHTVAYETRPDGSHRPYESQRAIIDAAPGIAGLYLSVAHVGHGVMSAPAAGEVAAAHILGRPLPDPAYEAFSLDCHYVDFDSGGIAADEVISAT